MANHKILFTKNGLKSIANAKRFLNYIRKFAEVKDTPKEFGVPKVLDKKTVKEEWTKLSYLLDAATNDKDIIDLTNSVSLLIPDSERHSISPKDFKISLENKLIGYGSKDSKFTIENFCRLIEASQCANIKNSILLVKKLINSGKDEDAAIMAEAMLKNHPVILGYFNVTFFIPNEDRRQEIQTRHLSRLKDIQGNLAAKVLIIQLCQANRVNEALHYVEKINLDEIDDSDFCHSCAMTFFWTDSFNKSLELSKKAVELSIKEERSFPHQAKIISLLSQALIALGKSNEALKYIDELEERFEGQKFIHAQKIFANLATGKLDAAFANYLTTPIVRECEDSGCSVLKGEFDNDVLSIKSPQAENCEIICVAGAGDEVRFSRLYPQIRELYKETNVHCDHRLAPIFRRSFAGINFIATDRSKQPIGTYSAFERWVSPSSEERLKNADLVSDLRQYAAIFRQKIEDVPSQGGHLIPDPALVDKWAKWLAEKTPDGVVGLFWRSDLISYTTSHKRSQLNDWLDNLDGFEGKLLCLQYSLTDDEKEQINNSDKLILPEGIDLKEDLEDIFAILAALDVVLTVPGTLQHMAGSVGVKTLCATHPYEAPWRRAYGRKHELWSPTVEIITSHPEKGLTGAIDLTTERFLTDDGE